MDETKEQVPVYSSERTKTATFDEPPEEKKSAESSGTAGTAESSKQTQPKQLTPWPEPVTKAPPTPAEEFTEFLKRTKRIWLIAAGAIFGLMAAVTAAKRVSEWARITREKRHEVAASTITPDRLIARCGQPAEDVTKDVFPIVLRTMSYASQENGTIVFAFSRTAEVKSDWVFLSMKDQGGAKSYDTPETKIAALPCLDSKK